ncbi:MAG TPA: LysR substrate-binding domain-containing protein [Dehalococcoidia bacterium]|nr:LysR substrate-binding domain-containing protein [Dehalococcoidia bacterium]
MNSHQLRLFLAVARQRSFSRAAEAEHLTQSAVSQQIEALEREHGLRLFERLPRRIELTDAGEALLPFAERVTALLEEAGHALAEVRGVARGRLRVAASPTPATYLLPPLLGAFARRHPAIEVLLDVDVSARAAQRVADGEAALGVVEGLAEDIRLNATPLLEDELLLVTPPAFVPERTDRDGVLALDELPRLRYLAREPDAFTRTLVDERLRARGVAWRPAMELGNIEAIKQAAAAGLGASFISRYAVAEEIAAGRLRGWRVAGLDLRRPWYLLQRAGVRPSPAAAAFVAMLQASAGAGRGA